MRTWVVHLLRLFYLSKSPTGKTKSLLPGLLDKSQTSEWECGTQQMDITPSEQVDR